MTHNFPFISNEIIHAQNIGVDRYNLLQNCKNKVLTINKLLVCNNSLSDEAVIGVRLNDFFIERATVVQPGMTIPIDLVDGLQIDNTTEYTEENNVNQLLVYTEYNSQSIDVILNVIYFNNANNIGG